MDAETRPDPVFTRRWRCCCSGVAESRGTYCLCPRAGEADLATEQFAELFDDRQSQTSARVLARQVIALQNGIALSELLKDDFEVAFRDAHTGVGHRDMKIVGIDGTGRDSN